MSIIAVDIGTSTTKIIEYKLNKIIHKDILISDETSDILDYFINKYTIKINTIEKIVVTGIGANKFKNKYNIPIYKVNELKAIGIGGLFLAKKEEALIVSIGTRNSIS